MKTEKSDEPCPELARQLAQVLLEQADQWERGSTSYDRAPVIRDMYRLWQGLSGKRGDSETVMLRELVHDYLHIVAREPFDETAVRRAIEFLKIDAQHDPQFVAALDKKQTLMAANRVVKAIRKKDAQDIGAAGDTLLKSLNLHGKWTDIKRAKRARQRRANTV